MDLYKADSFFDQFQTGKSFICTNDSSETLKTFSISEKTTNFGNYDLFFKLLIRSRYFNKFFLHILETGGEIIKDDNEKILTTDDTFLSSSFNVLYNLDHL